MTSPKKPRAKRAKYPKHAVTYEVVEAALEVPEAMAVKMHHWLDVLCEVRERLRVQRADDRAEGRAVRAAGGNYTYLTKSDQYKTLSGYVRETWCTGIHSQVLQNVADRIDLSTRAWLRGDSGPLRFKPRKQYRSFTFTQYGSAAHIRSGRLHLSRLGEARLIGLRRLPGRVKSTTLVFKRGRWFAQFTCEVQLQHCRRAQRHASDAVQQLPDTGLDTGLARVATLADGSAFAPAKPLKKLLPRLKHEQRKMSRQFEARKKNFAAYKAEFKHDNLVGPLPDKNPYPLSGRLRRQIRRVAILHSKIECTRRDSLRKLARQLEQRYRLIAVEEHGIEFMRRNRRTSRAVSDVAPGLFKQLLKHTLGPERYVGVPNRRAGIGGNSQTCLCGAAVPKPLSQRGHDCPACGLSAERDTVSANIAMLIAFGYSNLGAVKPPEPGQGFVRRGEGKCCADNSAGPVQAAEPPVKRSSSADRRSACTAGAQATAGVNNLPLLLGARVPCLSG